MAKIYYRKMIRMDGYTIYEVPMKWRQEVIDLLEENGYVLNEDGTAGFAKEEGEVNE